MVFALLGEMGLVGGCCADDAGPDHVGGRGVPMHNDARIVHQHDELALERRVAAVGRAGVLVGLGDSLSAAVDAAVDVDGPVFREEGCEVFLMALAERLVVVDHQVLDLDPVEQVGLGGERGMRQPWRARADHRRRHKHGTQGRLERHRGSPPVESVRGNREQKRRGVNA